MANTKQVWVSPTTGGQWKVKTAGSQKAYKIVANKLEAEQIARVVAINIKGETKIQKRNGKIQGGNSYGNDPFPPRDKNKK